MGASHAEGNAELHDRLFASCSSLVMSWGARVGVQTTRDRDKGVKCGPNLNKDGKFVPTVDYKTRKVTHTWSQLRLKELNSTDPFMMMLWKG